MAILRTKSGVTVGKALTGGPRDPLHHFANIFTKWPNVRVLLSVIPTLTLAINGGAILPLPGAFASTGAVVASIFMVIVALANSYTSDMLLYQAHATKRRDYETLGDAVAGPVWKFITELSIVVLLLGTLISGIQQIGESLAAGTLYINPNYTGILVAGTGRLYEAIAIVVVCAPLVFLKHLRQLEYAGDAGMAINIVLVVVVMQNCIRHSFPALSDGEFPVQGWNSGATNLYGLVSTYGYVFYIQPIMMPMLDEMPPGRRGVELLKWGTRITILGTGMIMYWLVGFFGAARFGADAVDVGNILENDLGGGGAQGALNIVYALYLILSTPPFEFAIRHAMKKWWDSLAVRYRFMRVHWLVQKVCLSTFIYGFCLAIALILPGKSAKVITVTGAVGTGLVSYLIPVVNHLFMYFRWARFYKQQPVYDDSAQHARGATPLPPSDSAKAEGLEDVDLEDGKEVNGRGEAPSVIKEKLEATIEPGANTMYGEVLPSDLEDDGYEYPQFNGFHPLHNLHYIGLPLVVAIVGTFTSIATLITINDD